VVGNVSNNTGVNYPMPPEVHQHVTIDCRAAKGASFDVGVVLLKDFAERLHEPWLSCEKEPGRSDRASTYGDDLRRREDDIDPTAPCYGTRLLSLMSPMRVKSGTSLRRRGAGTCDAPFY
jgi:hypothetical protein